MGAEARRIDGASSGGEMSGPMVSVVIPTYKRADKVRQAVASVLAQTYANLEVLVVHDGPDAETAAAIGEIAKRDGRVRFLALDENRGPAEARNEGIRHSAGEWIGFLDDDDLWLPEKLEKQIAAIGPGDAEAYVIITCQCIYQHGERKDVWPEKPIGESESLGDFLMYRPGLLKRPGSLAIHTLLVPRVLLEELPLMTEKDHEDWAWMFEAWYKLGARVRFVWEPLVVYNIAMESISRSRRMNWEESLEFAEKYREWIGRRAYNSFLATKVALKAKRRKDKRGLWTVTKRVIGNGPGWLEGFFLGGMWLLPDSVVHWAWRRSLEAGKKKDAE